MQSKVSMVVPVFNKIHDIDMMLDSVYNQVWNNVELILVNDGATDGTRERLAVWEPKFKQRGYDVIIIDQENQGISAAVRNGMLRMTGEYFCSVDCDDYLYPEYLSTMAGWLDGHSECDYTVCGFERFLRKKQNIFVDTVNHAKYNLLFSPYAIEYLLLELLYLPTWNYLFRITYLNKCKVIDNFITIPRLCQEPSILVPVLLCTGNLKYFPKTLIRHYITNQKKGLKGANERFPNYLEVRKKVYQEAIKAFPYIDSSRRNKLLHVCEYARVTMEYNYERDKFDNDDIYRQGLLTKFADLVNKYVYPSPDITYKDILQSGCDIFIGAVNNLIAEERKEPIKKSITKLLLKNGHIICYGVLGKMASKLLPALMRTELMPDLLWDAAANGEYIFGIDVKKPEYDMISANDIIIIMPKAANIAEQIICELNSSVYSNIIYHDDLVQYLKEWYYPELFSADVAFC